MGALAGGAAPRQSTPAVARADSFARELRDKRGIAFIVGNPCVLAGKKWVLAVVQSNAQNREEFTNLRRRSLQRLESRSEIKI